MKIFSSRSPLSKKMWALRTPPCPPISPANGSGWYSRSSTIHMSMSCARMVGRRRVFTFLMVMSRFSS